MGGSEVSFATRAVLRTLTLAQLATIGKALAAATPDGLYTADPNRFSVQCIALGMARAAYKRIKEGRDPLDELYRLEEYTDPWLGEWPGLTRLIDRLTIELDIS